MAANQNYTADNISVLEGLDAVRKRPGMYIGSVSRKGLNHLIYEIVDNSVDEHLAGACDTIHVTLEADGSCTVSDNGRGIPVEMHEKGVPAARLVFSTLHAGGKFDNDAYKTSGGLHGVGSSVVNALSLWMDVEISRDGVISHDRYEQGKPVEKLVKGMLPVIGKTKKTGTEIENYYASDVLEQKQVTPEEFIDVKALMGDTSDNIPGVPSIGEKRATSLIVQYHSVENMYEHFDEIKASKAKQMLEEYHDQAILSKNSLGSSLISLTARMRHCSPR